MKFYRWIPAAFVSLAVISCEDNSNIGSSIIEDTIEVVIDSSFTVSGHTVANPVIQARTDDQLLGRIDAKGYGKLSSDFISQLMPSSALDTVGVTENDIDSLKLFLYMKEGDLIGDSIVPMGLDVYRVNKALPSPIYSNFDPESYYSTADRIASTVYTASVLGLPDNEVTTLTHPDTAMRIVPVKLPVELGREFFNKYKSDPQLFSDPQRFARWFPGLYIKNSFGSGRMMRFSSTLLAMYYRKKVAISESKDTIYKMSNTFLAVTPEVINNNNINLSLSRSLESMASTTPIVVAPTGYDVEVKIPIKNIIDKYRSKTNSYSVVNSMTLEIPASEISNDYEIAPPAYMLLVRKDKKDEFFADQQLTDNVTSFYAAYNSKTKSYVFGNMRKYFLEMYEKDAITAADGEFILTPISLVTETAQSSYYQTETVVMALVPYIDTPTMAQFDFGKAKIKLTFSKQTIP